MGAFNHVICFFIAAVQSLWYKCLCKMFVFHRITDALIQANEYIQIPNGKKDKEGKP